MKLNNFQLKVIALILMTLSHIQFFIDINNILYIGQASFPIFAFLASYGMLVTSNQFKYIKRVFLYGIGLQILLFILGIFYINIFITIAIGLMTIYFYERQQQLMIMPLLLLAYFINVDYGIYGVLLVISPYILNYNIYKYAIFLVILNVFSINLLHQQATVQWFSILAIPLLALYNYELGTNRYKYVFYIYYPLHIVIIYTIAQYI